MIAALVTALASRIYRWLQEQDAIVAKQERAAEGLCICGNPGGRILTSNPPACGDCHKPLSRRYAPQTVVGGTVQITGTNRYVYTPSVMATTDAPTDRRGRA